MRLKLPTLPDRRVLAGLGFCMALSALIAFLLVAFPALADPPADLSPADPATLSDKQAEADRIKSEISDINGSAELAIERYNQANVELDGTRQKQEENQEQLDAATARLAEAQDRLDRRVSNIYRNGSLDIFDVLLSTTDFSDFLSRFDLLGRIGDQDRDDVEAVLDFRAEVQARQAELDDTLRKQQDLLAQLDTQKSEIDSQLAARQAILSGVEGDIAQMVAQQEQQQWQATAPDGATAPGATDSGGADAGQGSGQDSGQGDQGGSAPEPPGQAPAPRAGDAVSIAMQYIGVPYVWGGASPSGFDCSGLVMYVYAQLGIYLPHSAEAQYYAGTPISYSQLAPGDLVFFGHPISHVGIYIGGGQMIHAPFEGATVSIASVGGGGSYAGAARL